MTKKIDVPLILLAIAGFLAPLIGGQVAVDALSMTPGSDPWIDALKGAAETPTLSHAILAALCAASLAAMLIQRKILQVPNNTVSGVFMGLLALILSSISYSSFKGVSIPAALEWLTYGIAFYAVVASAGRQKGPNLLAGSIFFGCVALALLGISEYGDMKAIDPTWRIYPHWVGPNAMAAVLVIGFFLGLGLTINLKETAEESASRHSKNSQGIPKRPMSAGIALGCVAIGLAIFLTQSKGALLAMLACLVIYAILLVLWLPKPDIKRAIALVGAVVGAVVILAIALSAQSKTPAGSAPGAPPTSTAMSPGARFVNAAATSDQSVGFRKLLWQTSIKLIGRNPLGTGIGTFQYESSRPGLTTQTHFAHEAYLQLGAEASPLAPLLLIIGLVLWARLLLRGGSKLQSGQNVLRASVLTAVIAVAAHSLIDSDFSYYGVGLIVFMLIGIGLLLSTDAVAPEFLPALLRNSAAGGVIALGLLLLFLGVTESEKAQARGFIDTKSLHDAQALTESLRSMTPWDADVWYLSALTAQSAPERLEDAKKTVELGPSTRNLRAIARLEADAGMFSEALEALQRASMSDPNNLQTLSLLADIQLKMGYEDKFQQTLQKLVNVEETPYFKVRSLPDLVPTETYAARIQLATKATDAKKKADLLQPAIDGYKQYLIRTVPTVIRFAKSTDGPLPYGGEDLPKAQQKMAMAATAAKALGDAYRALGDGVKAAAADADAEEFAKPLDLPSAK